MQSRETRFVLRIESGDRQGEQVPLAAGKLQVGRKPECGLVLKDGSVSGTHAEFVVGAERVELVDLGSTNGTRVGGQKIERAVLSHGDTLLFGNIRVSLHDAQFAGDAPPVLEGLPADLPPAESGALGHVSADMVKRSAARPSRRLPLILGLLIVLSGGGAAYLRFFRPSEQGSARVVVPAVPGNLLADGSFEEGTGEWTSAEAAPVGFLRERGFANSGNSGLGVKLEADGWSLVRSAEIPLHARRAIACAASLRVDGSAVGRLGLELSSSTTPALPLLAWTPARGASSGFEALELALDVPTGYDRARLVIAGRGPGSVAVDDVSALEREPAGGAAKFQEYELAVLGGSTAAFVRSGTILIGNLDLSAWTREGLQGWPSGQLAVQAGARGFELSFPGVPPEARLHFKALRPDAQATGNTGWVASTGAEGYAAHSGDFTRSGVESLLLGSGTELLRLGFQKPVEVSAVSVEGAVAFSIALAGLTGCELQLTFAEERAEAATLAGQAADAERRKDLGGALAAWGQLLDRFPYERKLVAQATETRARLVQAGLNQVDELRRELERARFFLLPELFANGRAKALELAQQYKGSEVELEAQKTAEQCHVALTELRAGDRSGDDRRLKGVLEALDPQTNPRLTEHVRDALQGATQGGKGN
ncbi:MAG: FHA domain-containing protein [Planctomycetes bacterium]|nr:FHA domain-containing protein [Planctomycetota bacterium]